MRIFCLLFLLPIFLWCSNCSATHLRAGEIQVRRISCTSYTFEIKIIIYLTTTSSVTVGGVDDFLSFGDGSPKRPVAELPREILDAQLGIAKSVYTVQYTYAGPGKYVISYHEPNRNEGILNMDASGATRFYIESMIVVEHGVCNNFPVLLNAPLDRACQRSAYFHNPGGFDQDGDSLSYEIAIPKKDNQTLVSNYRNPNNIQFYSSFSQGNEGGNGPPSFEIDPITGILTWDAPGMTGEYLVAIKMTEWKKDEDGIWSEASYVIRDMQIIVEDCDNRRPILTFPEEICVVAGEPVKIKFLASDPDGDSIRVDFSSELLELPFYQAQVTPTSSVGVFKAAGLELLFSMNTSCALVRNNPYLLTIRIADRNRRSSPLSKYYTIKIFVIAPPPKIETVTVNPVSKQVTLRWSMVPCDNVESFQIWRRTSVIDYQESKCSRGMPGSLRYDLMAVVPKSENSFIDKELDIGTQYCYRILAIASGNTPGKLSRDTCLIPKEAEAPVLTNVSVEETDTLKGKIFIRWREPFDIDKTQYPPPYQYQLVRKNETLNTAFERVGEKQYDTTFVDQNLNTADFSYRYFVELYVGALSNSVIDSSSQASSIIAKSESTVGEIGLRWSAKTPWSNYSAKDPYHLIFRSTKPDGPFELIDSVNVLSNNFNYADRGRYRSMGLTRYPYFYKIETRGTYGNPAINEPLKNLSQVFMGQLLDTIPPCAPTVSMEAIACNQFSCDGQSYYTSLRWESPEESCDEDVVGYEVLVRSDTAKAYSLLARVTTSNYRHSNLTNLDYCYRIVSIDHVGNRSDSTDAICNSSCINFKLPNVITPGLRDEKNDFLATFDGYNSTEVECARSVRRVTLAVYNRLGQEIFVKSIDNAETNILWPGINSNGIEVSAGTYFYNAQVEFQTNDPSKRKQDIKGWVHVLR